MTYIIKVLAIIAVSFMTISTCNFLFAKMRKRKIHLKIIQSAINVLIGIISVYSILNLFEVTRDISQTIMKSGTFLIAICTFSAQKVLANTISGMSISVTRPFDVGDKIRILSATGMLVTEGIVIDINLRHTVIKKFDGQCDIVPNSIMDSSIISNTNFTENIGNFIDVELTADSDIDKAYDVLKQIILENEKSINEENDINITIKEFTSKGIILRALVKTKTLDDSFIACSEIRKEILVRFEEEDLKIPFS